MPRKIIFHNPLSPGDVVVSSALIRDLHVQYPGEFLTGYTGVVPSYFDNAPHIVELNESEVGVEKWRMTYNFIHQSNQSRMHFLYGYYHDFNEKFGLGVQMSEFKPDIHFSEDELARPIIEGRYWVICSGGKTDFITKWWDPKRWQEVVDKLKGQVKFVQVGQLGDKHIHPPLNGVLDLRGKTSFRELCCLINHADGVCCVITCLMHLAAACNRPCVVVAGGREAWWWEAYTRKNRDINMRAIHGDTWQSPHPDSMVDHIFFHSIGKYGLSCCATGGCWKSQTTAGKPEHRCTHVMQGPTIPQPKCLMHVSADEVVNAIKFYEESGHTDRHDLLTARPPKGIPLEQTNDKLDKSVLEPPVTICTLLYGPFIDLHQRVLSSIVRHTPPGTYELRVGFNEVCKETMEWFKKFRATHPNVPIDTYISEENIKKYPMMRRMFHDPNNPITTRWTVWLDDDSHIVADDWLQRLSQSMREQYKNGHNMWGKRFFWQLAPRQIEWIKAAKWYHSKPLRKHKERFKSDFATGGFWAVETSWLQQWDWPDPRINHNGGDIMMGEAIYQTGGNVKNWDYGVKISDAKRRGYSEKPVEREPEKR